MQEPTSVSGKLPAAAARPGDGQEVTRLGDLSPQQWRSGIAAWLGWLFDGLDMHLYTLVATPFVAELLVVDQKDPSVGYYGSWIQAAFLVGWALGGGFFGRIGDRVGRARALVLTILTYAVFTGLSVFAQAWWHLLMVSSIAGNFVAAAIARWIGYRRTIVWMFLGYFGAIFITYNVVRTYESLLWWMTALGASSGLFALFTMYLPPLFSTLLRTTGAGFCYNIGRIVAAAGTVFFGLFREVNDYRFALLYAGFFFLPAAAVAMLLPEPPDGDTMG